MDNSWVSMAVVGGAILLFLGMLILGSNALMKRSIRKMQQRRSQPTPLPEGYVKAEGNAYVIQASQTSMMINQYPVMKVLIAIFPQDGPMLQVETTHPFTYAEIPYLRANEPVRVSYEYNATLNAAEPLNGKSIQNIKILGPSVVEWEGDASVKDAASQLVSRIEGSRLVEVPGTILQIEQTGALLGDNPVFRYRVRFQTLDGQWIEGETYQAARPWLERQRRESYQETVQYSATNSQDFIFSKR